MCIHAEIRGSTPNKYVKHLHKVEFSFKRCLHTVRYWTPKGHQRRKMIDYDSKTSVHMVNSTLMLNQYEKKLGCCLISYEK